MLQQEFTASRRVYWLQILNMKILFNRVWYLNISSAYHLFLAYLLLLLNNKVVVHFHNDRRKVYYPFSKLLSRAIIYSVSDSFSQYLRKMNLTVEYIPEYIRPRNVEKRELRIGNRSLKNVLFSLWKFSMSNFKEVYGGDLLIELIYNKSELVNWHLFIGEGMQEFQSYLKYNGIDISTLHFYSNMSVPPFLHGIDILLRLNRKDGFGLVVQEALESNCMVLASDCCRRAAGTHLFDTGSYSDLEKKFEEIVRLDCIVHSEEIVDYEKNLLEQLKMDLK